jgi:hypothetical protein
VDLPLGEFLRPRPFHRTKVGVRGNDSLKHACRSGTVDQVHSHCGTVLAATSVAG